MRKLIMALLLALQFSAVTQIATAEIDIPTCWPCDGK